MAKIRTIHLLGVFVLLLSFLAGCRAEKPTASPTPTEAAAQVSTNTPYPGPEEGQFEQTEEAYPAPSEPAPESGYPVPATPVAAYPQPQADATAILTSTASATPAAPTTTTTAATTAATAAATASATATVTVDAAYPGPNVPTTSGSQSTSYPQPGSATPAAGQLTLTPIGQAASLTATATPAGTASGTALPSMTPTISPTPLLVRTSQQVTDPDTFKLAAGRPQLIEFFATWSPLSNSMAPVLNNLEERYNEQVVFTFLDIDDPANSLFKTLLGERVPPVFYLLDANGNYIDEWQGYTVIEEFEAAFSSLP